jgi:hypothetical protein
MNDQIQAKASEWLPIIHACRDALTERIQGMIHSGEIDEDDTVDTEGPEFITLINDLVVQVAEKNQWSMPQVAVAMNYVVSIAEGIHSDA